MNSRSILRIGTLIMLLAVPIFIWAGTTGKIAGRIFDESTGDPLPGANIIVMGTTMGAMADMNGEYFIINIPPGKYTVKATMMGYKALVVENVRVISDLTTTQDFALPATVLDIGEEVTIVAERPLIEMDMTASRTITTAEDILAMPVEDIDDIVALTAGATTEENIRGGRDEEIVYKLDGITLKDPVDGNLDSDIPLLSLQEMSVETGGFSAEYGEAMSGIVSMVFKEGGPSYSGQVRYKTNDIGSPGFQEKLGDHHTTLIDMKDNKMITSEMRRAEKMRNVEFSLGGPEPLTMVLFPILGIKPPGTANMHLGGEYTDTHGRFPGQRDIKYTVNGKLSYRPSPNYKLTFHGFVTDRDRRIYSHSWKNTTYESELGEDLNHDGDMTDVFSMLDNLPRYEYNTDQQALTWTHTLSPRTFYEVRMSRYMTKRLMQCIENINEDTDGDGHLDLYYDVDGDGVKEDVDGDGDNSHEDLNGNLVWDWNVYGPNTDLYLDENDNDFIDASEGRPRSEWLRWEDLPTQRYKDTNNFYIYGYNETISFPRAAQWYNDKKEIYTAKVDLTSQVTPRHLFKMGGEAVYMEVFSHTVDLASGGNVYGENYKTYPNQGGLYITDKMEYQGMIVNAGMRFDWFDANWDNFPADPTDPVPDSVITVGGIIKNPIKVSRKTYWEPRLGVAYPITEQDVLYFSYGRFMQQPVLRNIFRNVNFDLSGAFGLMGNANLEPQRTTAYEIGVKHQFLRPTGQSFSAKFLSSIMPDLLKVNGFFKDITGLVDVQQTYYSIADWYGLYINEDYGNIRGFEINLVRRRYPGDYFSGSANYTYMVAKGKSSSDRLNYDTVWAEDIVPTTENYLDWDQRHTVNTNLEFRVPRNRKLLFGTSVLDDAGMNVIFRYGSGMPYSPPKRSKEPEINTERFPWYSTTDVRFDKRIGIGKKGRATFFVWIDNIFNRLNIDGELVTYYGYETWYHTFTKAQEAYDEGVMSYEDYMSLMDAQDPNDANGNGITEEGDGVVDYNKKYPAGGPRLDPRVYMPMRRIRFGIQFEF
ncbi:TonB-dependent receptor [candidate division KSB1 bacterium]|nr:TonB-dependent receptor [candidate division KSB1 bacterium]